VELKKVQHIFVGGRGSLAQVGRGQSSVALEHKTVATSVWITGSLVDWASDNQNSTVFVYVNLFFKSLIPTPKMMMNSIKCCIQGYPCMINFLF
jgi:hypothetical protein